jgi:hypothetical protein
MDLTEAGTPGGPMRLGYQLFAPGVLFCELLVPTKSREKSVIITIRKQGLRCFGAIIVPAANSNRSHTGAIKKKEIVCLYIAHS